MAKIERIPLIKRVSVLERVTLEDGTRLLLEPKKADIVRRNIEHRKIVRQFDSGKALSMELRQEGLLPRGFGSQFGGWS